MDGQEKLPKPATTADGGASTQPGQPRPHAPVTIPDKVGHYRVADRLGTGAMGEVLLAHDRNLSRNIALKRIRADRRATSDAVRRFQIEAHVTARLQHPAIVPVYQYVEDGKDSFYTMRPVQGMSLGELVGKLRTDRSGERKEWPTARLVRLFLQVCNAVAYAHSMGVLHRDLKPANIMIGPFEEVLVLDWGMAAVLSDPQEPVRGAARASPQSFSGQTASQALVGTPAYMAPELHRREPASFATEVFALGVVLYELLALKRPWEGRSHRALASAMDQPPHLPTLVRPGRGIPARLDDVVMKAIDSDPRRRYPSVREFAQDVADAVEGRAPWAPVAEGAGSDIWRMIGGKLREDADGLFFVSRGGPFRYSLGRTLGENVRVDFALKLTRGTHDLSVFLNAVMTHGGAIGRGYGLGVVPGRRRTVSLSRSGRDVAGAKSPSFTVGRWHRVTAERDEDHLSLLVDGEVVCTYHDPIPLMGGTLILQGSTSGLYLRDLRVSSRGANATVSCLSVPDALFNRGYYEEAQAEYDNIGASHRGRIEAILARFRFVLCAVEMARREDDAEVRTMLLNDAKEFVRSNDPAAASSLSSLALAITLHEQREFAGMRDALGQAFQQFPDDPHLPTIREWILAQLHSATDDDRRLTADLLPVAMAHCSEGWGRHGVRELVHRVRKNWETPSFMIGRGQFRQGVEASRAEAILFCAFWAGHAELIERLANELVASKGLRSYHVSDFVFSLLELQDAERARRVLDLVGDEGAVSERAKRYRIASRAATTAAGGDVATAERMLGEIAIDPFDRAFNSARLWIARSWDKAGDGTRATEALKPVAPNDFFAHEHRAWFSLLCGDRQGAGRELEPLVERNDHLRGRNLVNFLYGAYLMAQGREREARRLYSSLAPQRWPRTWTLGSYYGASRLGDGSVGEYLKRCLPWERTTFEQHKHLLSVARSLQ